MSRDPNMKLLVLLLFTTQLLALPEPEAGLRKEDLPRIRRQAQGGKCTTSADCIAPNVCSKWGWCQWTKIYGEDGPSQGANVPGQGRSGQCVTSADCASRVPYCSKLGFCHGGRLPFDEEQLEIPDEVFAQEPSERPQGYINNDVQKNSPLFLNNERAGPDGSRPRQQRRRGQETTRQQSRAAAVNQSYQNRNCPEQSQEACVANACQSVSHLNRVFEICSNECRKRCA